MHQVRKAFPVLPDFRIERTPGNIAGVEPHRWLQALD